MPENEMLIFVPTYNERENVKRLVNQITALNLEVDILFMDDSSPDKTGDVLDQLALEHNNLKVIHRCGKLGIGTAHVEGIRWAYDKGYTTLVTMDADFTHSPRYILDMLKEKDNHDIVVGSRYMRRKSLKEWNLLRKFLTKMGHFLTEYMLEMPYDATGAFRLYSLERVPKNFLDVVTSKGYSFFFESLYVLNINKYRITEIPINLPSRTYGHSKMTLKDIFKSVQQLFVLYFGTVLNKSRYVFRDIKEEPCIEEGGNWDQYWNKKKGSGGALYDTIASLYRKFIIKPSLNYFNQKHFPKGANVLHAGCGSGQVDEDLHEFLHITAMDFSEPALELYKKYNKNGTEVVHGNILEMPFEGEKFDGIYNLGVMEHFSENEIQKILSEFKRVLKPNGKAVLFWPPEFGLSVNVLKMIHFTFNNILRRNIELHPAEISRVKSKEQIKELCEDSGLKMIDYYFGPRDFFTQSVIVLSKEEK